MTILWIGILSNVWLHLSGGILSDTEQHALVDMLQVAQFDSSDVCFLKDWDTGTRFKLSCQVQALNNPWSFLQLMDELKAHLNARNPHEADSLQTSPLPALTSTFVPYLDMVNSAAASSDLSSHWRSEATRVKHPKDCFRYTESLFRATEEQLEQSFAKFSAAQRDSLTLWLYLSWQESEDEPVYKPFYQKLFAKQPGELGMERVIALLGLIDMQHLAEAWNIWEQGCLALQQKVRQLSFTRSKPIYHASEWGPMLIGGIGNDRYSPDCRLLKSPPCLIIEPAGDDIYEVPLYADWQHPFYLVIDLKGDDLYRNQDIGKCQSVLAGCGWVCDYAGDDIYQGGDFALSARLGFQSTCDESGNDLYCSGLFSQAAAMFGMSILQDNAGNDSYTATEFAQGLAGTKGIAILSDYAGDDTYYTGGKYLHKPLAPFDYRSMAQGFGFGFRPDLAGGIGILYDAGGNDRYDGGVYAQGVAYWYAIGALIDETGNDYYDAVYYPQGSGIHLANGFLFDGEGEDHYYSKHGPGQGNGHDWSVGVFVDKAGNDQYSVEGGNGLGLTNSVGIFVDCQGDDKYENRTSSNYGYATPARETGGLGLFLDAGGKDTYPDSSKADGKTWQQGTYGIGRDAEINAPAQTKLEELAEQETATVDSLASIDKLFSIASGWAVGSAQKQVNLALKILCQRDREAVPYVIRTQMASKDGLVYRALEELTEKSKLMRDTLYTVLRDSDSLKVKNAMSLISGTRDTLAVDSIAVFLQAGKYIPTAIACLGAFKAQKALDYIQPWLFHPTEKYRYLAARSLKAMNTPQSLALLRQMADDPSFLIKAMVRQLK